VNGEGATISCVMLKCLCAAVSQSQPTTLEASFPNKAHPQALLEAPILPAGECLSKFVRDSVRTVLCSPHPAPRLTDTFAGYSGEFECQPLSR
jgi:hypothetical protein